MSTLRIGIVGCGEAAQIMHLPALRLLGDRFEVSAVCDADPEVAEAVGARWDVPERFSEWSELVALAQVDVVLVSAPHALHAPVTLLALEHEKHVLVEKPMCLTLAEADALVDAQREHQRVVQVGYMRRYAPAFLEAGRLVAGIGVRLARVHDVLGHNELIGEQTADVIRTSRESPLPALALRTRALLQEAVGVDDPSSLQTYQFLLTLNSHDLSAMRELFGFPLGILYAARRDSPESPYITAAFDYGSFVCQLETGFDRLPRVDQHIKVFGDEMTLEIRWGTGFVRHWPVTLTVAQANDKGLRETLLQPDWSDPFVHEWIAFHHSVVDGAPCKADVVDGRADLELALGMVKAIQAGSDVGRSPAQPEMEAS